MKPLTRAVIDIGTNSVKLLVADVTGPHVQPLFETSEQTRLGSGFYETHRLQPAAIEQTAQAVAAFAARAADLAGVVPRVIATSATRDAVNPDDLRAAIRRCAALEVEIITGEQEAEWVFTGVATDPALEGKRLLILDVGGGSSEFILGERSHHVFRQSFPLGSVRLLEKLQPKDPPSIQDLANCRAWLQEFFNREIAPAVEKTFKNTATLKPALIGTGGTVTILARIEGRLGRFNREEIEGMILRRAQILDTMVQLWSLSLADRKKIVGLPPKRADIILMGVAIYEAVMGHFDFEELYVSTRGLRFGALLD